MIGAKREKRLKPALLLVGRKARNIATQLRKQRYLTYVCDSPNMASSENNPTATLDKILQRDHPDIVVLTDRKEKLKRQEALYRYIKESTKTNNSSGIRVIVPEQLTPTIKEVDSDDSYLPNPANLVQLVRNAGVVWARMLKSRDIPDRETTPKIFVATGPTCAGKTTVSDRVAKLYENGRLVIKHRAGILRPTDSNGVDYIVRPVSRIRKDISLGVLLGYRHYGREYGIPVIDINNIRSRGEDAMVVVAETDAVAKIINHFGEDIVRPIYLYTTADALETRLYKELGHRRSPDEIKQRMREIREQELESFYAHPEMFAWWVPNHNPYCPEDSRDFAKARQKYWDDREIARCVNWVDTIMRWEYNHDCGQIPQHECERQYVDHLVTSLFGYNSDELIERLNGGKDVHLVSNGQLTDYVRWLREEQNQRHVDTDHVRQIIDKKVLHASDDSTLTLFFEPYMDINKDSGTWSDKEIILGYIEALAGPSVHRNNMLTKLGSSAFGNCGLSNDGSFVLVDDGLFYALSLPPSSVKQAGKRKRLAISFLREPVRDPARLQSRTFTPEEREHMRHAQYSLMSALAMHRY